MTADNAAQFVVVTTIHKAVFAGLLEGSKEDQTITLREAQMCVYWSNEVRGVLGLAAGGPTATCRVTAPVPSITLQGVTAVMVATPEAEKAWRARPWN